MAHYTAQATVASAPAGVAPRATQAPGAEADRLPPAVVPPIVRAGIRYAEAADGRAVGANQPRGVLVAADAKTGRRLWTLVVYPNPIDPTLEEDVQWIFFRTMAFDPDGRLRIVDESGRTWRVDVARRLSEPAR